MTDYLLSVKKQFEYYKLLGEKTFSQLTDEQLLWQYNEESNSIAIIVKHMWGNMLSRWTDFLATDGEKEWRQRDAEFENDISGREELMQKWNEGWNCLFNALDTLTDDDLNKVIYIRNQGHTVVEAINRQLAHYPYHVGQIVFIGKMLCNDEWTSLLIPRGTSTAYNNDKFSQPKRKQHFTDEYVGKGEPQTYLLSEEEIGNIADEIDMGMKCFIHRETHEVVTVPDELHWAGADTELFGEEYDKLDSEIGGYYLIEPLQSSNGFQIMADFTEQLDGNERLRSRLVDALNKKHPFRNFKYIIDDSGRYRQEWFDFKKAWLVQWVKDRIAELAE